MTGPGERSHRAAAWALGVPAVLLYLVGTAVVISQLRDPDLPVFDFWLEGTVSGPVILTVALVLLSKRPDHRISHAFALLVAAGTLQTTSGAGATTLLHRGGDELGAYLAWIHDLAQMTLVVALVLIVLVFPTGRLPSTRWRPIAWAILIGSILAVGGMALRPGPLGNFPDVPNPIGIEVPIISVLEVAGTWTLLVGFGGAVLAPILRFRGARGAERAQLRWFAFAVAAASSALVFAEPLLMPFLPDGEIAGAVIWTVAPVGVVVVLGLTVLRYRLYDIDRIVSRTVSYVALTLLLVAVYAVGVIGLGSVVRAATGGGGGDLVVAASTLLVAAAFGPLRRRVQAGVDRRFNRARYDAQRTVESFTQRLRDEVDIEVLTTDVGDVAWRTLQPVHASVWLSGEGQGS